MGKFIDIFISYKKRRNIIKFLKYQKNKLWGVYCPICKDNQAKFKTFGLIPRKNAQCNYCGSLERHRLLYLFLIKNNLLISDESSTINYKTKLLHFAPQLQFYKIFNSNKSISYFPCDLNPENFKSYHGKEIHKVDITKIPFENKKFDFVICNHVLEHVEDDRKAMEELNRVLRLGGKGIFLVPIDNSRENTYEDFTISTPNEREIAFGQHDHVRIYGKDYIDRLQEAGFKVNVIEFYKAFSQRKRLKYGLHPDENIYFCEKL